MSKILETKEDYHKVKFHDRRSPNEKNEVEISVNGEALVIKRGIEVIIPDRFKQAADCACYPYFTQQPGQKRKYVGKIKVFPYDLLGKSTEAEYKSQKTAGDKMTKEKMESKTEG